MKLDIACCQKTLPVKMNIELTFRIWYKEYIYYVLKLQMGNFIPIKSSNRNNQP